MASNALVEAGEDEKEAESFRDYILDKRQKCEINQMDRPAKGLSGGPHVSTTASGVQELEITPEMIRAGLCVCSHWEVENVGDLAGFVGALYRAVHLSSQKSWPQPPAPVEEPSRARADETG